MRGTNDERIAVVGPGCVGLPLLFALTRVYDDVVGFDDLHAVVLAVPHDHYLDRIHGWLPDLLRSDGILIDVRSKIDPARLPAGIEYWSL